MSDLIRLPQRVAVVSHCLPPSTAGTGMRLYRLLRDVEPADYRLLTCRRPGTSQDELPDGPRLAGACAVLPPEWRQLRIGAGSQPAHLRFVNAALRAVQRAVRIAAVASRERCGVVLAVSGEVADLPAACLASLMCGARFVAEVDDYYSEQWTDPADRAFARWAERLAMRRAARVIVLNDAMREEYTRRYGVKPTVVPNPIDEDEAAPGHAPWPAEPPEISLVFAGAVYHLNADAIAGLCRAIAASGRRDVKLHIYTFVDRGSLGRYGITDGAIVHDRLPWTQFVARMRRADILFLPLGFRSLAPHVVRTTASFKMTDYLVSGRPVLVHAPADSFMARYFATNMCGVVADSPDAGRLTHAIDRLIGDAGLRATVVANAQRCARRDFGLAMCRAAFLAALGRGVH